MKKILLALTALLTIVGGVKATVTFPELTTDPNNPVLYCIQSYRSYRFVQYAGDNAVMTQTYDCTDANTKFYFVAVNGTDFSEGVKIVSNVNGKEINGMSGFADTGTTWFLGESTYGNGGFNIATSNTFADCWDCDASGVMTVNYWDPNTEGSTWQIAEAPQYETSTLVSPKWYYLKSGRGRYVFANGSAAGTTTTNPKTSDYMFAFVSVGGTGVNIVSRTGLEGSSNQYITTTTGSYDDPELSDTPSAWYYFGAAQYPGYFLFSDTNEGFGDPHLLNDNGQGGLSKWYVEGVGSYFQVEEVLPICDVTYNVILAPSGTVKVSALNVTENQGAAFSVPSPIAKDFCTYTYYSDAACTSEVTTVPVAATATVYALASPNPPFTVSTSYATATWYNLKLKDDAYPLYTSGSTPNVSLPASPGTENDTEWAFIGNPYDGYQIINKGAGDGYELSSADDDQGTTGDGSYATMTANGTQTYNRWFLKSSTHYTNGFYLYNSNNHALNKRDAANLAYWTDDADAGSTFTVSSLTDNATELTEIANRLDDYTYGSSLGEYSLSGDFAGYEGLMEGTIIPGLKASYSYEKLVNARALEAAKSLNIPVAPCFLHIQSTQGANALLKAVDSGTLKFSTTKDKETIFLLTDDGKLISYTKGLRCKDVKSVAAYNEDPTYCTYAVEAAVSEAIGKYSVTSDYIYSESVVKHYLYSTGVDDSNADRNTKNSSFYANNTFTLEKVTALPVTISAAAKYATLYSPVALTIPDGVKAYYISKLSSSTATLTEIETTIPANTGVILYKEDADGTSIDFTFTTGGTDVSASNKLAGSVATQAFIDGAYTLQNGAQGVGLYPTTTTTGTLAGFKAYLPAGQVPAASVKGFTFVFDGADGITTVQKAQNNDVLFDLSGRRVKAATSGIFIVNGKKVVK